ITGGHSYSYTQATGVVTITFAGSTNAAAAELVLESITFGIDASDNDPSTTARTVTLNTVTDNGGGANTNTDISETATISVGATDDAISINNIGNTVTFTEDAGATTALFAASIDTIETGDTITQVILTLANIEVGDTLSFGATDIDLNTNGATVAGGFTYTVSSAGISPVVTITHAGADDATVNTMLNGLVFNNTANNEPSTTARTVTLTSVTDSGSGTTADGTVATVNVTAVNDAPSIDTGGEMVLTNVTEDDSDPSGDTVSAIIASAGGDRITDPDTGAVEGIAVINVDDTNGQWQYSTDAGSNWTAFGSLSDNSSTLLNSGALIRFVPNADYTGSSGNIEFRAWDQTSGTNGQTGVNTDTNGDATAFSEDSEEATLTVTAVNDEPTLTATGSDPTFTEGGGAVGLFSGTAALTVESGQTITGLTFTVKNVTDTGNEQITIDGATITLDDLESGSTTDFSYSVSVSGTTATITLSGGTASTANVVSDIDNMTYINNSQDPTDANRKVTITAVVDSGGTANGGDNTGTPVATSTVNVNPVNDAIDITVTGNTVLFTEDSGATTSLFSSSIDTIEAADTISQVILTMANVESGDMLSFGATNIDLNTNGATVAGGFTYTVSSAGVSPVVTITHAGADDATVNTMLNSLVFNNTTNNDPGTTARTVTLTSVTDSGSGTTADGTVATVNVAKADDAIDITVTGNTVLFTEDAGATSSLFSSTIDTIETGDTITQVILTMSNVESGDTLSFGATDIDLNTNGATVASGFTYTVSSAGATPIVTITHAGTDDATVNTMLNSLVFNNTTNNDPGTTARTVTLTSVTDSGSGLTADGTVATVNVTTANDV
ncbi:MAG: hypothetical protein GY779_18285, partial [Gammaproteobacteria bacterium]|nr:hypothetical protein [Gammaproteobacteria bacterium]